MRARTRVTHVVGSADTGGAQRCALELVGRLDPERFDTELLVAGRSGVGPLQERARQRGIALRHVPFASLRSLAGDARLLRALAGRDLVHVHSRPLDYQIAALLAGPGRLGRGPRLIWTRHLPYEDLGAGARRRYRWSARWTRAVVACSPAVETHLQRREGVPALKVHGIPNGVDASIYRPPRVPSERALRHRLAPARGAEEPVILVSVGRLAPQKGMERLLDTAARLAAHPELPPWQLWIVGDGPDAEALGAQRDRLGLAKQVKLLGERDDVAGLLRAADVFVLLSRSEGLPLAVLEALASGLPAVVTDLPAYAGLAFGPALRRVPQRGGSVEIAAGAAANLAPLLRCAAERRALGRAAREEVLERFRIEDWVERHEALYDRVLGTRSPA